MDPSEAGQRERNPGLWEGLQIHWRPGAGPGGAPSPEELPEWLVTNGLGGFACGTVPGLPTRRYHGWLVAAVAPPVDRRLLWAATEEWVRTPHGDWPLSTYDYGDTWHPDGWKHLAGWRRYPFPSWVFQAGGVLLERRLFMVRGQNTTVACYRLLAGPGVELSLKPLINCRDYHHTVRANAWPFHQEAAAHGVGIQAFAGAPPLILAGGGAVRYEPQGAWYYHFHYALEAQRGLDHREDHFCPGTFHVRLAGPGDTAVLVGHCPVPPPGEAPGDGTPPPPWRDGPGALARWAAAAWEAAVLRRRRLAAAVPGSDPDRRRLALAADDFVVWRRTTRAASIIAGYPWFTDWGRDAMISLPGLLLATGRHDEARQVLLTFAQHRRDGLVPNRFADAGEAAAYNAVDASLWFVFAVWKYFHATGDAATIRQELLPAAEDILRHYARGTRHGIRVGTDGLVYAGEAGLQLTWMDAKVGDWVVTPRRGAPVEVNALWYNALRSVESLAGRFGRPGAAEWGQRASRVRRSFLRRFPHPAGWLRDGVPGPEGAGAEGLGSGEPGAAGDALRPNQVLAVALPFPVVDRAQGQRVVAAVARHLWTPVGLRTLAPGDPAYRGLYTGDQWQRDGAYHQGTVWPWLLGPFISGLRRCLGSVPRRILDGLRHHLRAEAALGQVSEIFDGDPPHRPRGCFAQAWSVAEVLRVWAEELEVAHDRPGDHDDGRGDGFPGDAGG